MSSVVAAEAVRGRPDGALARIAGAEIYHEVHGSGPALVIVPAGAGRRTWWQQVPVLARTHTVVILDPRAYGRSGDTPEQLGPLAWIDDLAGLLDHLGIERAAVLGHSMSGRAAFGFASRFPARTSAVILVGSTGGVDTPGFSDAERERRLLDASRASSPPPAVAAGFAARRPDLAYLFALLASAEVPGHPKHLAASLTVRPDPRPVVAHDIALLAIVGVQDEAYPPAAVRGLASIIPSATLLEIAGAGHCPHFERAEEFNAAVVAFLAEHRA